MKIHINEAIKITPKNNTINNIVSVNEKFAK